MNAPGPLRSAAGIGLHGCGLFLLPFVVGGVLVALLDAAEVADTGGALLVLGGVFILPPLLLQLIGVVLKVAQERDALRDAGRGGVGPLLASVHRHIAIVTPRGWAALFTGLWFFLLSLGAEWASLGTLAVLALLLFYAVLGAASFLATFQVRTFSRGLGGGRAGIRRELSPAVVLAGEPAEERFVLAEVPVPAGFTLLVEDANPRPLGTESRYAVGAGARRRLVTLAGTFRRTPRGLWRLGPAHIWFEDAFGFTRTPVASLATAELKVLPRFRPLEVVEAPESRLQAPDNQSLPHRMPTEDPFRFKEYVAGDDTRRIHWRLSVRAGRLMVRQPETRETTTRRVVLALDTHQPAGAPLGEIVGLHAILDALVEAWIALGAALVAAGDRVTLVAAVDDGRGATVVEALDGAADRRRWQDLGARARWQSERDLPALWGGLGEGVHAVALTARLHPAPPPGAAASFTWVVYPPLDALGPAPASFWVEWLGPRPWAGALDRALRVPGEAGSDRNSLRSQLREVWDLLQDHEARRRLRARAQRAGPALEAELLGRGDAVYRLEPGPVGHRMVRVVGGGP